MVSQRGAPSFDSRGCSADDAAAAQYRKIFRCQHGLVWLMSEPPVKASHSTGGMNASAAASMDILDPDRLVARSLGRLARLQLCTVRA